MKFTIAVVIMFGVLTLSIFHSGLQVHAAVAQASPPSRSVWDGVYTDEQANRGEALYNAECASCHGSTLEGGEMAPPLAGASFTSNWNEMTLGDLYERIRLTMPEDKPGKLTRQQNSDVVAYMLKANNYPVGKTELEQQAHLLKQIRIEANRSDGKGKQPGRP